MNFCNTNTSFHFMAPCSQDRAHEETGTADDAVGPVKRRLGSLELCRSRRQTRARPSGRERTLEDDTVLWQAKVGRLALHPLGVEALLKVVVAILGLDKAQGDSVLP